MSRPHSFTTRWWVLIPFCAALFIIAADYGRIQRVIQLRNVGRETSATTATADSTRHWLVIPEHTNRSYQWLIETEQALTKHEWRIRQSTYDNVPTGREIHAASPYRWWLEAIASIDHKLSHRTFSQSVEQAALWSAPLLHMLLLLGTTLYAAKHFGSKPAAFISLGLAVVYPFAGEFLPGAPDDHGLAIACTWLGVLFLIGGLKGHRASVIASGITGGIGLWLDVSVQVPVLIAIGVGALLLAVYERRFPWKTPGPARVSIPWNSWALAGALTGLLGYFAEYFPAHLDMRLQANHPLYGVAWIGLGQLLTLAEAWRSRQIGLNSHTIFTVLVAAGCLAALPIAMALLDSPAFLIANPQASRLTNLPDGAVARNFAVWVSRDGVTLATIAALLPLVLLVPAIRSLFSRDADPVSKRIALFIGSIVLVGLILAVSKLQWWSMSQLLLLALVAIAPPFRNFISWVIVAVCLLPGVFQLGRTAYYRSEKPLTGREVESLVERDIAHWIADRAGHDSGVVLVSPDRTAGFAFHGGLRGLGSTNWENSEGVTATIRIIDATTPDEAVALLNQRGVTHIVLPSWDIELDEFVRLTKNNPNDTLLAAFRRWALPNWAQPLAYRLPDIPGFEGRSVLILKVTENADTALSLSRMADYFVEIQDEAKTEAANEALKTFPASLSALISRAQIEKARGNNAAFDQVFAAIQQSITNRLDRTLPWDRRVNLAATLAQGNNSDLAKAQAQRCITEMNDERLRSLNPGAIYRLLVLSKAYALPIQPKLRELALSLLPPEASSRL